MANSECFIDRLRDAVDGMVRRMTRVESPTRTGQIIVWGDPEETRRAASIISDEWEGISIVASESGLTVTLDGLPSDARNLDPHPRFTAPDS